MWAVFSGPGLNFVCEVHSYQKSALLTFAIFTQADDEDEAVEEEAQDGDAGEEEGEDDDEDEDEDGDEDEEVDPLDSLKQECQQSAECAKSVKDFQACTERVTKAEEDPAYEDRVYKEDCVEEFFHLQQCVNKCAAPKLFSVLK